MTTKELNEKFGSTLWQVQENEALKKEIFSNLINNLYDNKVIYHERNTVIAHIETIVIDTNGFSIKIDRAKTFMEILPRMTSRMEQGFDFGASWSFLRYNNGCFSPYSGWGGLWTDPDFVKKTIELVDEGRCEEASELLWKD